MALDTGVDERRVLDLDELPAPMHLTFLGANFDAYAAKASRLVPPYRYPEMQQPDLLATFGLRFDGESLLQDDHVIMRGVTKCSMTQNRSGDDFALAVEKVGSNATVRRCTLVRKHSRVPLDCSSYNFQEPVFVGDDLLTVSTKPVGGETATQRESGVARGKVEVRRNDVVVFEHELLLVSPNPVANTLTTWGERWAIELPFDGFDGQPIAEVWIDGKTSVKKAGGYDEVFDWTIARGKPLFFHRRGSRYGVTIDGMDVPFTYDDVFHGGCCEPAEFTPHVNDEKLVFHARRGRTFYVVVVDVARFLR
jgi:hypothetical protein